MVLDKDFDDNDFQDDDAVGDNNKAYECYVCLEVFSTDQGEHMCEENEHFACYECARKVIERSMKNIKEFPASCCSSNPWPLWTIWSIAPTTVAEKYEQRVEEHSCPIWLRVHCANPDCTCFRQSKYHGVRGDNDDRVVRCLGCETLTCVVCRKEWKEDHLCEKTADEVGRPPWLPAYSENCRIKLCPNCREWIEHGGGCNSMFCEHCDEYFCFVCLLGDDDGCRCPPAGDPEEGYDEEGYERTLRAIHRDTGLNREGLNAKEILERNRGPPRSPPSESAESELSQLSDSVFSDDQVDDLVDVDLSQIIIVQREEVDH
ncbi:hypothetical protein BDV96DRAFT_509093 [Lophiotrema nucula]|uniref:RING-type domain-containing protein n=1 Tax=Lophiotrema nucula TaxID=690887 RepID=A0A6A5YFA5_9PLEO|nr:hypothetical protein BDV96DRAFT_509093 [Lophiotrema nucula]